MGWPGPMTHRQFEAWCHWRLLDDNTPSRLDSYLMQIACEVRRVLAKDPSRHRLEHFKLKFGGNESAQPASKKEQIEKRLAGMAASIAARGGFTKEQIKEMVAKARAKLEGTTDG